MGPTDIVNRLLEIDSPIESVIKSWIAEAGHLPDEVYSGDLFAETSHKGAILDFFTYVLRNLDNPKFRARVEAAAVPGVSCTEAWSTMNSPGHPVRDGLILLGKGLEI